MKFEKELLRELTYSRNGDTLEWDDEKIYTVHSISTVGEWRWGYIYQMVFDDGDSFWGLNYRLSSGDGDWTSWDDWGDEVEVFPVQRREKVVVVWEPVDMTTETE